MSLVADKGDRKLHQWLAEARGGAKVCCVMKRR